MHNANKKMFFFFARNKDFYFFSPTFLIKNMSHVINGLKVYLFLFLNNIFP